MGNVEPIRPKSDKPVVISVLFGEGGLDFIGFGQRMGLSLLGEEEKARMGTSGGPMPTLQMELDRGLGGVVVRYSYKNKPRVVLVPLSHCKKVELAE